MADLDLLRMGEGSWVFKDPTSDEKRAEEDLKYGAKTLNLKQMMFVQEFLTDFNATRAAKKCGYSSPSSVVQNPLVRGAVRIAVRKQVEKNEITSGYVLSSLKEIVDRCKDPMGAWDPQNAIKGLELIGKNFGMFVDRVITDVNQKTVIRIESNVNTFGIPQHNAPVLDITPDPNKDSNGK